MVWNSTRIEVYAIKPNAILKHIYEVEVIGMILVAHKKLKNKKLWWDCNYMCMKTIKWYIPYTLLLKYSNYKYDKSVEQFHLTLGHKEKL